jgi:hypothetical protein
LLQGFRLCRGGVAGAGYTDWNPDANLFDCRVCFGLAWREPAFTDSLGCRQARIRLTAIQFPIENRLLQLLGLAKPVPHFF